MRAKDGASLKLVPRPPRTVLMKRPAVLGACRGGASTWVSTVRDGDLRVHRPDVVEERAAPLHADRGALGQRHEQFELDAAVSAIFFAADRHAVGLAIDVKLGHLDYTRCSDVLPRRRTASIRSKSSRTLKGLTT